MYVQVLAFQITHTSTKFNTNLNRNAPQLLYSPTKSNNSNMAFLWLIFAYQTIATVQSDLISCDQPVIGKQLCKVNKTIENKLIEVWPDFFDDFETPLKISSVLTIDSIPEFNENEGTITFNLMLKLVWNDTRMTIKSDDPKA